MLYILLTLAFLLELVAFVGFAFVSSLLPLDKPIQIVLGIFLFIALIVFWSLFMAPKAVRKFSPVPYYVAKSIIYAICAVVLFYKLHSGIGIAFIVLAFLDEAFLYKHNLMTRDKFNEKRNEKKD